MEFGVFDHLDRAGTPLSDYYEDRLKIIEAYDRAGFYAYHLAEHHSTPLGMAPSPNVFLAAVAQRTRRLRFGPLVYALPLHHPLRLIEEICMLDHLSGGRVEIGFGRGSSPVESTFYGEDPAEAQEIYAEALDLILRGLTHKELDFHGKHFNFDNVPMEFEPRQKPHPPIWYGVHAPDSAERAARRNLNVVSLDPTAELDSHRALPRDMAGDASRSAQFPKSGWAVSSSWRRPTQRPAARPPRLSRSGIKASRLLFRCSKRAQTHPRPADYDTLVERGQGIAGSPATVREFLASQLEETGCNYVVGQFAFGDMARDECLRSIGLFAGGVMPALRANDGTVARESLSLAR